MKQSVFFPEDKLPNYKKINGIMALVIFLSVIIRGFFAWTLELGNDEVYYWTYALFPDLSHFDHPPMVGFVIQAFSWDLHFNSEFFIRLGSVVLGGFNTWIIYQIGKKVDNKLTGFFAALLYNASVYCFVIAGIFILPDTPQLFFWLISLYLLLISLPDKELSKKSRYILFFTGIIIGLAMLSKYTSVFLWFGAGLYIILFNRRWLKTTELYLSILLSLLVFVPVLLWNIENKFISFTFQSERVSFFGSGISPYYFFTELFGQILYNNPVNFVIIILSLLALSKKKFSIDKQYLRILLLSSFPLIILFLFFAIFRRTLPHWTGPAYIGLIIIAAAWLSDKSLRKKKIDILPKPIMISIVVLMFFLVVGLFQIKLGIFTKSKEENPRELGKNDITLDIFGWRQFAYKFSQSIDRDFYNRNMPADAAIISHRWFPAAHLDYYLAIPKDYKLIAVGSLERIHKYAWINRKRPGLNPGSDAYFITSSRDFQEPAPLYSQYFETIEKPEIIRIYKRKKLVENFFVFRMRNLQKKLPDVLEEFGIPLHKEEFLIPE